MVSRAALGRLWIVATLSVLCASPGLAVQKTNVVIILCDDLGYGDVGIYGRGKFETPEIDRLADAGARLTHFYAPCPFCAPTRASLHTGRYPFRCGMMHNPFPRHDRWDTLGLPASEVTLGELFQQAGYRTALIGKWHLGHKPPFYPTRNGYDEYFGILYSNDMRPVELLDGEKVVEYPVVQATLTRRYTERAVRFIEANAERGYLLILAHAMPHKPLAPSEAFFGRSGKGLYGDVMAELDWSVGQVRAAVERSGAADRTLIWFTSDNGPWYGGSTGGLRGMKGRSFEGGTRVPLIAVWPRRIPAGHRSDGLGVTMDIFATSLAAVGIEPPKDRVIDGANILPMLTGDAPSPHEVIFSMQGDHLHRVRSGPWSLLLRPQPVDTPRGRMGGTWYDEQGRWRDPNGPDGVTILAPGDQPTPEEYPGELEGDAVKEVALFNIEEDPAERRDVAAEHPEVVERLRAAAAKMQAEMPEPPRPATRPARTRR